MRTKRTATTSNAKYKITKSKELWVFDEYSKLNINEFRILQSYLALINPFPDKEDKIKTEIEIPIDFILKQFNLKKSSKANILKAIDSFKPKNTWYDLNTLYSVEVFEKIETDYSSTGQIIRLKCSKEFEKYLFNLNGNYITYYLSNISMLNSTKHIVLYELLTDLFNLNSKRDKKGKTLENKKFNSETFPISIKVDTLINILNLNDICKNYTDLQNKFLRKAVYIINQYTDIHIDILNTVRTRNTVYYINLTINNSCNDEQEQQTADTTDTDDNYIDNIIERMNDNESYSENVKLISEYFNISCGIIERLKSNVSEYDAIEVLEKLVEYNKQYYYISISENKTPKLCSCMTDEATSITTDRIR